MSVVRFMMLMPWGRVGSNLLFAILRQTAPMKLANENLNKLKTADEQSAWFKEFYEIETETPSSAYIGSKQSSRATRDMEAMKHLIDDQAVRVIRLRRDNHVKAAVSQIRAEIFAKQAEAETGVRTWALKKGAKALEPTRIDPALLLTRINLMQTAQDRLMKMFSADAVLDIEYEQTNSNLDDVVRRLQEYLDLPHAPYKVPHEKLTPDHLQSAITNYAEIADSLSDTPYRSMI